MAEAEKSIPTGLARAIRTGDTKMLEALLDGTCANFDGSVLVWKRVAVSGHPKMVPVLIGRGFDVDDRDDAGNTALMNSVCAGNAMVAAALLNAGADAETKDENDKTALMRAARRGDSKVAKILVEGGADVNASDKLGWCALAHAADKGHPRVADYLVRAGADSKAKADSLLRACSAYSHAKAIVTTLRSGEGKAKRSRESWKLFLKSTVAGHVQTAEVLLRSGASSLQEGLLEAAQAGQPELAILLLNAGAHVNVRGSSRALLCSINSCTTRETLFLMSEHGRQGDMNKEQTRLLLDAVQARHEETVEVLLRAGAIVNPEDGSTPGLLAAADLGQLGMAEAMIRWGADIDAVGDSDLERDTTALHQAVRSMNLNRRASRAPNQNAEMVRLLVDLGADVNVSDSTGRTPLMIAAEGNHTGIMESVLAANSSATVADQEGRMLLRDVADRKNTRLVKFLLDAGADANAVDHEGRTPLMHAAGGRATKNVKLLLAAGANVNAVDQTGRTPLMDAANWGTARSIELLLAADADANAVDHAGRTPLMCAADGGNEADVELLLAAGADANAADQAGRTALMVAAGTGNAESVKMLLVAGADASAVDHTGRTPLMHATHGDVVDVLVWGGANVNHVDKKGQTPLVVATYKGLAEVVEHLLDSGAASSTRNESNQTLIMIAAELGHANTVATLRNRGINTDETDRSGQTALIIAARKGYAEAIKKREEWEKRQRHLGPIKQLKERSTAPPSVEGDPVQELLKAGADVNARGSGGFTALMAAAKAKNTETIRLLLKAGADIDAVDDQGKSALLQIAKELSLLDSTKSSEEHTYVMKELLHSGADTSIADHDGLTALIYVVAGGVAKAVDLLLTCGADPSVAGNNGHSPLMIAMRTPTSGVPLGIPGNLEVVQKLLFWKANPNETWENGETPLIKAAQGGDQAIAAALINAGADPNARDEDGWTALMHAAKVTHSVNLMKCLVEHLVEAGANVNATNNMGETALVVSIKSTGEHGGLSVIDVLVRAGTRISEKDKGGLTAMDYAKQQNNSTVLEYFRERKFTD